MISERARQKKRLESKRNEEKVSTILPMEETEDVEDQHTRSNMKQFSTLMNTKLCYSCGQPVNQYIIYKEERICPKCHVSCPSIENNQIYAYQEDYNEKNIFLKHLSKFQGAGIECLPNDFMERLDNYFSSYSLPTGHQVRTTIPKNHRGERRTKDINIASLFVALKEAKMQDQYENVRIITFLYWGWDLPNLKKFEVRISKYYDEYMKVCRTLFDHKVNNLYLLWWFVCLCGFDYEYEDFRFMKTRDTVARYDLTRRKVSEILEWKTW